MIQIAHSHTSGARNVYLDDLVVTGEAPARPRTWSYPNLHGDVIATADNDGQRTWIGWHGPYGENPTGSIPGNTNAPGTAWGWHGQHQRLTDHALIHLGARPYDPTLGRFLAVDPVEGGSANAYDYANQDPCNQADLDGLWPGWIEDIGEAISGFVDGACKNRAVRAVSGGLGVTNAGSATIWAGGNTLQGYAKRLAGRSATAAVMAGRVGTFVKGLNVVGFAATAVELGCNGAGKSNPWSD